MYCSVMLVLIDSNKDSMYGCLVLLNTLLTVVGMLYCIHFFFFSPTEWNSPTPDFPGAGASSEVLLIAKMFELLFKCKGVYKSSLGD